MKILVPVTKKGVIQIESAIIITDSPYKNLVGNVMRIVGWMSFAYTVLDVLISMS